jgi:D-alanine-D-alanine ligase-like ATP-grasp enzyme
MVDSGADIMVVVTDEGAGGVRHFARTIAGRGLSPVLITPPGPDHWEAGWAQSFDDVLHVDNPYDWGTLVRVVREYAAGRRVRGIFSCYDGLMISTARAARSLGLPCPMIPGLERARDKNATRIWSQRAGLPTPPFALISSPYDAEKVAAEVGLPAIIKPVNGTASHLVRRVDTVEELAEAYVTLLQRVGVSFGRHYGQRFITAGVVGRHDPRQTFLVERYAEGIEYSVDIIVRQGIVDHIVLLEKFLVEPVTFHESGFLWPQPDLSAERESAIWRLVDETVHALGVDNSMAHIELIDTADGPVIIEVNAGRLGGLLVAPMAWAAVGVDLAEETVSLYLVEGPPPRAHREGRVPIAGLTVFLPGAGEVRAIHGIEEVAGLPGVVDVMQMCSIGDTFPATDHEVPAVGVLVSGIQDRGSLARLYTQILDTVVVDLAPSMPAGA